MILPERPLGIPVWWNTDNTRYPGTALEGDPDTGYLVTLHQHPTWRWVTHVPPTQLAPRDETPELIRTTENGIPVTSWMCPWPGHHTDSGVHSYSSNEAFVREGCARYMPPFGHRHDTPGSALIKGIDPSTVPIWTGGDARPKE